MHFEHCTRISIYTLLIQGYYIIYTLHLHIHIHRRTETQYTNTYIQRHKLTHVFIFTAHRYTYVNRRHIFIYIKIIVKKL